MSLEPKLKMSGSYVSEQSKNCANMTYLNTAIPIDAQIDTLLGFSIAKINCSL